MDRFEAFTLCLETLTVIEARPARAEEDFGDGLAAEVRAIMGRIEDRDDLLRRDVARLIEIALAAEKWPAEDYR